MHLGVKQQYKPSYQVRVHIEIIVTPIYSGLPAGQMRGWVRVEQ